MLGSETRNVDHLQGAHYDFRSGAGGEYECMKDAAILVTSLLQFQLEGFAPQILVSEKASRLNNSEGRQCVWWLRRDFAESRTEVIFHLKRY